MSTRSLILIFAVIATALILALVIDVPDVESVANDVGVVGAGGDTVNAPAVVGPMASDSAGDPTALDVPEFALDDPSAEEAAGRLPEPEGRITGVLVDDSGVPIPNEPVAIALFYDTFDVIEPKDADDEYELVARTASDAEGRFSIAAHRHALQSLLAGGNRWVRTRVTRVVDGDDLRVVMKQGHMLEGLVVDEATDLPIAGASVFAGDRNDVLSMTKTNDAGVFRIGPLDAEDVLVAAWIEGYDVESQWPVAPVLGEITIALGEPRRISGRVIDNDTSEPVTTGEVTLRINSHVFTRGGHPLEPEDVPLYEVTTTIGEDGAFTFDEGVSTAFELLATNDTHYDSTYDRYERRTVPEESAILLRMRPRVAVEGLTLLESTAAPLPGTQVVMKANGETLAEATSDAEGRFVIDVLEDWDGRGSIYLHADHPDGYGGRARVIAVSRPQDIELVDAFEMDVLVTLGGEPVAEAEVAVISEDSETTHVTTGADGKAAVLHTLGHGGVDRVQLVARHAEHRSLTTTVDIDDWRAGLLDGEVELELDGGAAVTGVVMDNFGEPVPSALVRVERGPLGRTDVDGRFSLRPVTENTPHTLRVFAEGHKAVKKEDVWPTADAVIELSRYVTWPGRIVDVVTGEPLASFRGRLHVETYDEGKVSFSRTQTRVAPRWGVPGEFTVTLADAGRYRLAVEARGSMDTVSDVIDFDGVNPPPYTDIYMAPSSVFEARVIDTFSRPVAGLTVTLAPWELAQSADAPRGKVRKASKRVRTDDDGVARFDLGEGGMYRVALQSEAWFDNMRVDILPGPVTERSYRVAASASLELTVVDAEGKPAPGTRVSVRSGKGMSYSISRRPLVRSADGVLLIESLPAGDYSLNLRNRRFDDLDVSVSIAEGQFLPRRLVLPERGSTPKPVKTNDKNQGGARGTNNAAAASGAKKGR